MDSIHDVIIIGGGPAGFTAGLYASRSRLDALLFEGMAEGGVLNSTDKIENYPAVPDITGFELGNAFASHGKRFGLTVESAYITGVTSQKDAQGRKIFLLVDKNGKEHKTFSVIIASGGRWRKLGVEGEDKFRGKGISYCATCDGPLYRDRHAVVVGGGNSAVEEAIFLTRFASKVTLVHRRAMLRASKILQEELSALPNAEVIYNAVVSGIGGDTMVKQVLLRDVETGEERQLACDGVFIFLGQEPNSGIVKDLVSLDERGFIRTGRDMSSSVEGIFAAGDVVEKPLRQVVTAASDGAVAAYSAELYVRKLKGEEYR